MTAIGSGLAQSLVRDLGPDCSVAAKVSALLRARPGQVIEEREFLGVAVSASETGSLLRSLADFERRGWCLREGKGWRSVAGTLPSALPDLLQGAGAMWRSLGPRVQAEAVVTMPLGDSRVIQELRKLGLAHVGIAVTKGAFLRLASSAERTLTVASPFLNEDGMSWALELFRATQATERHLVVRARGQTRDVILARHAELRGLGVHVFDYAVASPGCDGFETFHAKVLLADDTAAYVGSANMLVHDRPSLELGVILEGGPVPEIAALLRAIRMASQGIEDARCQHADVSISG